MKIPCENCLVLGICKQKFIRKSSTKTQDILDFDITFCSLLKDYVEKYGISKLIPIFNNGSTNICVTREYKLFGVPKKYTWKVRMD